MTWVAQCHSDTRVLKSGRGKGHLTGSVSTGVGETAGARNKSKETDFPLEAPERNAVLLTPGIPELDFSPTEL